MAPVTLGLVAHAEERALWRELVERYHYLGHKVAYGAHLRYSLSRSPVNCFSQFTIVGRLGSLLKFRDLLEHAGTDVIRLPHRSPNLNAYVERFVLSIKSECLERMIFFSEPSLRRAVAEFIHHYHGERNHQGLGNALLEAEECVGSPHGKVRCRKRLGGLLSYYHRDAA